MINKMKNWVIPICLFLFLIPHAPAQITPNLWKEFIGEPVLLVTPGLVDHSYAGYKNGAEAIPETFTQTVYNVNDYGATPNDNASDTAGIRAALSAANANSQGGVVFFAAGQYDIFLDGETTAPFNITRDNVIIQGSGAQGASNGGTTLKMHNNLNDWLFRTDWCSNGQSSATKVKGSFIRGTKHFDVWAPGGYTLAITQANLIGYKTAGGSSPTDAYVEGFGSRVTPDSLYEAQLERRLGSLPAWINTAKTNHTTLIGNVSGQSANPVDVIPGLSSTEQLLLGKLLTYDTIIFNELHNSTNDQNDWVELRNVSPINITLDNWQLTIQTEKGTTIIPFPTGTVIPAGGVLLLKNTEMTTVDAAGNTPDTLIKEEAVLMRVLETFMLPQNDFALIVHSPKEFGDLAGNYFQGQKIRPETAPTFTMETVWERKQPVASGYRAEAWAKSTHRNGLGTPGYLSLSQRSDVNNDGAVNILDLVLVASKFGTNGHTVADLNGDNTVDIRDLVLVANALNNVSAAPTAKQSDATVVNNWLKLARENESNVVKSTIPKGFSYERGIQILETLARALTPNKTALLANYPNPFNPETWIPYQLSKAADVTVTIYASDGNLIRTLTLGHQAVGMYKNRSQAVYWDGTNEMGESVASGVYFYTLTAGTFSTTRKMLILK